MNPNELILIKSKLTTDPTAPAAQKAEAQNMQNEQNTPTQNIAEMTANPIRVEPQQNAAANDENESPAAAAPQVEREALIKFAVGALGELRHHLLSDTSREQFAVMIGRSETAGSLTVINALDTYYFEPEDFTAQSAAYLGIKKDRIGRIIREICEREDADTIIDIHTHPFSNSIARFSGTDDSDEIGFMRYLSREFPEIHYASVVFSRTTYSARVWTVDECGYPESIPARLMTATPADQIPDTRSSRFDLSDSAGEQYNRSILALGIDTMRKIMDKQLITLIGAGGLGSIIAENLIHSGFTELHIVDNDTLSVSNMNRIVGATMEDARAERPKVDTLREHLLRINPAAIVHAWQTTVPDPRLEEVIARSSWVIMATDNHTSRFVVQESCIKYSTPFISAGVNITVDGETVKDISGEVITARPGDNICLSCLGRLDPIRMAHESHPDPIIRDLLVKKGYVTGADVKEPAVKTLNAILAALTVNVLINQYTQRQKHEPIWVYEDNDAPCIYPDRESVELRAPYCHCGR